MMAFTKKTFHMQIYYTGLTLFVLVQLRTLLNKRHQEMNPYFLPLLKPENFMHNTDFGTLNQGPLEEARYVEEMKSRLDSLYLKLTFAR